MNFFLVLFVLNFFLRGVGSEKDIFPISSAKIDVKRIDRWMTEEYIYE